MNSNSTLHHHHHQPQTQDTTNVNNNNNPNPASSSRQQQLQEQLHNQRVLLQQQQQQQQQQLFQVQSYSPGHVLPPLPITSLQHHPLSHPQTQTHSHSQPHPLSLSLQFQNQNQNQQQPQHYFAEGLSPTHTSPPTSASASGLIPTSGVWSHRTSNSRDEVHQQHQHQHQLPLQHQQQHHQQLAASQQGQTSSSGSASALQPAQSQPQSQSQTPSTSPTVKRESAQMGYKDDKSAAGGSGTNGVLSAGGSGGPARVSEDPMPSTSDFVKKLYKMLEDPAFQPVVCWGPLGDCFVVKDMNEFTKSILPRMFKHSNFASFVRQLNKYDFHKVKNTDDAQFGEHSWTFRHPDFHADRRDALENIKRKVPAQRKPTQPTLPPTSTAALSSSSSSHHHHHPAIYPNRSPSPSSLSLSHSQSQNHSHSQTQQLLAEIGRLKGEGDELKGRIRTLERNYESVLVEMVGFQRGMAQQDGLMQSLIGYFMGEGE